MLVAIAPKDGVAKRLSAKGVRKNDTLLFVIDVKSARTPLAKATGDAVAPVAGLPTVARGRRRQAHHHGSCGRRSADARSCRRC